MKYLIEIHQGIGDVVQILGIVDAISKHDKEAFIGLIILSDDRRVLLEDDTRINVFYKVDIRKSSKKELLHTILDMRREKYDYVFFFPISDKIASHVLAFMIGGKKSVGEQFQLISKISSRFIGVPKEDKHIVERDGNLLKYAGICDKTPVPRMLVNNELFEYNNKLIGICIGTSKPQKNWDLERYLFVADYYEKQGYDIAFIGGKVERERFPLEKFELHKKWKDYLNKLNLVESSKLISTCCLLIGGDTGMMHIGAALQIPTVTIFSCTSPYYHAPYSNVSYYVTAGIPCQYCYEGRDFQRMLDCKFFKCLDAVKVEEVINTCEAALHNNTKVRGYFKIN